MPRFDSKQPYSVSSAKYRLHAGHSKPHPDDGGGVTPVVGSKEVVMKHGDCADGPDRFHFAPLPSNRSGHLSPRQPYRVTVCLQTENPFNQPGGSARS